MGTFAKSSYASMDGMIVARCALHGSHPSNLFHPAIPASRQRNQ
jgi:hypothetical protein